MDRQSVTLLPFNRVNYILSVAGAISAGDCNCLGFFFFFICTGSKFMKFQWSLICLHWFILTADLWNFNFLFILRPLEMESFSDNRLQWMEMMMVSVKWWVWGFFVFFLAWICSEIFNFTWFGFEKKKEKEKVFYTCMRVFFSFLLTPGDSWCSWHFCVHITCSFNLSLQVYVILAACALKVDDRDLPGWEEVVVRVDAAVSCVHLTDSGCLQGFG